MKKKSLIAGLLALSLILPAAAQGVEWEHEPADWAREQMEDLADGGILGRGRYYPTATVNRGQFCYFMVNIIQRTGRWDLLRAVEPMPVDYFADVTSGDGFGGSYNVYTAAAYGLTEGALVDGRRLADCGSALTREQAAKMMCSLLDALGDYTGMERETAGAPRVFADADAVSPWAAAYVDRASALGILKGDEAGRFNPQGILTFQEACVMLDRAFRAAEEAGTAWGETQGIRTLYTSLEEDADDSLTDRMTQMYALKDGSVLVIHGKTSQTPGVWVEEFDGSGRSTGVKEIPVELAFCAGFYESDTGYYLAFGQDNMEENDSKEVYRIVRYDKDWKRVGAASVTGGESYTTEPFRSTTHTGMAEENGTLVLHTARLRYLTPRDGLRHQSNITIKIRTSDMKVLSVSPAFPGNHVSHSFAQYVAFDGGEPVYADHGDAYPRGFALNLDAETGYGQEMNFFSFSGPIGQNATYAVPGGLGIGADNYLFAGASSDQDGNDKLTYCNVFLAVIPKDGFPRSTPEIKWLTGYPKDEQEYVNAVWLVPMNNNTFVVLWQSCRKDAQTVMGGAGDLCYAVFDGEGRQIGRTRTAEGFVAPVNDPAVVDNRILWVRPEFGPYGVFSNSSARQLKVYELEIDLNEASRPTPAPVAPLSFTLNRTDFTLTQPGETFQLKPRLEPEDAVAEVAWRSSDPTVASVAWNGLVTAVGSGTATITATVEGVGSRSCTVRCVFRDADPAAPGTAGPGSAGNGAACYREDWGNGQWLELQMVDGDTVRLSGCMPGLPSYYNYVVLQAYGEQAEVPLTPGEAFALEVTIDTRRFLERYEEGKLYYVIPMVCQNHQPGAVNLAGLSFEDAGISLAPDGAGGCTLRIMEG